MMTYRNLLTLIVLPCFFIAGCAHDEFGQAPLPDNYEESIADWQEYRIGVLTDSTGWLRLADLIWLDEGENSFGTGSDRDIQFPEGTMPESAGSFTLTGDTITMRINPDVEITHDGSPVEEMTIFDGNERPKLEHESLIWYVDSRGDDHGIRIYNKDSPKADAFAGFPAYPLDERWHLRAQFTPHDEEKTVRVVNVQGEKIDRESPGKVEFEVDGERYSLDAFESASGLFLMFTDETNQTETYQAGRYMIVDHPEGGGELVLDFNQAYNPPCAFSKFTTCQLPPPQNRLEITIEAGEKRPVDWEGI